MKKKNYKALYINQYPKNKLIQGFKLVRMSYFQETKFS